MSLVTAAEDPTTAPSPIVTPTPVLALEPVNVDGEGRPVSRVQILVDTLPE